MSAIFLIGVAQALFFALLIFNKPVRSLADKVLAGWLVFIGLHLLLTYIEFQFGFDFMPHLLGIAWAMPLAQGPFFFLYVQTLVRNPQRIKWQDGLHFIPYLLAYVFSIPFYLLSGAEKVQWMHDFYPNNLPLNVQVFSILTLFSGMTYALYVLYLVYRHKKNLRTFFSFTDSLELRWIQNLALGMAGIWVVVLLTNFSYNLLGIRLPMGGTFYIFLAVTFFVFAIGYFGFKQTDIFVFEKALPIPNTSEQIQERYAKSGLKTESADKLVQRLTQFMEMEKPYLQAKLTLGDLAASLNLSTHHLSQLINEHLDQNFFDFVNGYRVKAFKASVQSPASQHLTLIAIAHDCGFNSKSSFNRIFKEISGQTPSQYLASLNLTS